MTMIPIESEVVHGKVVRGECDDMAYVEDENVLICSLDKDHTGLHYDDIDDITWKKGRE